MSNNKVESKCTLSDQELIERCNEWVHSLAKSRGDSWVLEIPVNFNRDPDVMFIELGNRLKEKDKELEQLRQERDRMRKMLEGISRSCADVPRASLTEKGLRYFIEQLGVTCTESIKQ